jgi:hypothetical protein
MKDWDSGAPLDAVPSRRFADFGVQDQFPAAGAAIVARATAVSAGKRQAFSRSDLFMFDWGSKPPAP